MSGVLGIEGVSGVQGILGYEEERWCLVSELKQGLFCYMRN